MAWKIGSNGNDWLIGTSAADIIKGAGGDDTLKGGGGADHIDGGAGIDTALYADSTTGVMVDLATGRGYYGTAEGDTLVGVESLYGSSYADSLFGNDAANELRGLGGDDYLYGRGGADFLVGEYGDDLLIGGAGGDYLSGGPGYDFAGYSASPLGVIVSLASGWGSGGDATGDWLSGIEGLYGSAYHDVLYGDAADNVFYAGAGADWLYGGGGADGLMGGTGDDRLYGEDGNDQLYGEAGDDTLGGGRGLDVLAGGADADTFVWSFIGDTGATMSTADIVADFNRGEGDRLDLSGIDADASAAGNQPFSFIGAAPFSGTPGEINYVHAGGDTYIQMQTDASTDVEGMIRIFGIVTPEAGWFVL
jgi:Ca2+-binding RTX toxin-like protein